MFTYLARCGVRWSKIKINDLRCIVGGTPGPEQARRLGGLVCSYERLCDVSGDHQTQRCIVDLGEGLSVHLESISWMELSHSNRENSNLQNGNSASNETGLSAPRLQPMSERCSCPDFFGIQMGLNLDLVKVERHARHVRPKSLGPTRSAFPPWVNVRG